MGRTLIQSGGNSQWQVIGDKVRISGNFFQADADGVFENSMTIRGAMTAPEFLFRFTAISKQ